MGTYARTSLGNTKSQKEMWVLVVEKEKAFHKIGALMKNAVGRFLIGEHLGSAYQKINLMC